MVSFSSLSMCIATAMNSLFGSSQMQFLFPTSLLDWSYFLLLCISFNFFWKLDILDNYCCFSVAKLCLFVTSWTAPHQSSLSFTISQNLLMSVKSVLLSNHLMLCRSFLLFPSVFPSVRVFSHELALCIMWPKHWSFSFSISPSNEYSGLISFRVDLHTVQGTRKSLLQHHNLKASILRCSAFFMVPFSYPYMTTGKYHSFDYTDLCQLFNMVSGLVTVSLPRSKRLLITTAVIILSDFGVQGNKICHCFCFFPFYFP